MFDASFIRRVSSLLLLPVVFVGVFVQSFSLFRSFPIPRSHHHDDDNFGSHSYKTKPTQWRRTRGDILTMTNDVSSSSSSTNTILQNEPKQLSTTMRNDGNDNYFMTDASSSPVLSLCPPISPATGLSNQFYKWKYNQMIRYQCTHDATTTTTTTKKKRKPIVLIHGLFVNSDHWRKILMEFTNHEEYIVYALDLLGCGYSDKPFPPQSYCDDDDNDDDDRKMFIQKSIEIGYQCNGENQRFLNNGGTSESLLQNVQLGSATKQSSLLSSLLSNGGGDDTNNNDETTTNDEYVRNANVNLRHPLGSPYNFYTWSTVVRDFVKDVVVKDSSNDDQVALVCNSIGTMTTLQAVLDDYDEHQSNPTFSGVFVISPNFRELHTAEITTIPQIIIPIVQSIQKFLRETNYGKQLFDSLAKPNIVKQILKEPYYRNNDTIIDDTLVQVLLDPLVGTPNARNVVFDTLSYSAGPLPEQQLSEIRNRVSSSSSSSSWEIPIWVCYGTKDPWTPGGRVERLKLHNHDIVRKVIPLPDTGHCPHDESPELVHPLLYEFLSSIYNK